MRKLLKQVSVILFSALCVSGSSIGQKSTVPVVAGKQYDRGFFHRWLWGAHYRKEWAQTVNVPLISLDSAGGGLTPYEAGGGRQSKSLRLRNAAGREYVLRSIDKTFGRALPEIYQGSFIEKIMNDQVSIGHPYSAITISPMAEAAGIYHSKPIIGFLPAQNRLDTFNNEFGNMLFLLEQRADENWEDAPNFGNSKKIIGTEKLFENLSEDNDDLVDQKNFLRARLFDIVIGDWGRHEDQWRWARFDKGERKIYRPVPRDRDQAYTKFDGVLLKALISVADLGHLQTFDDHVKDITQFSYPARNLDRRLLNEPSREEWISTAKELQAALTPAIIEGAVRQLPPEIFPISGPEIIRKLQSRVTQLHTYAEGYYLHLAKEVQVVGSEKREYFEVKRLSDEETSIRVFKINKKNELEGSPLFSRVFRTSETGEIRLFGLDGKDVYHIEGDVSNGIRIRIIGGPSPDSIINKSSLARRTEVYDNRNNFFDIGKNTRLHLSNDTSIHQYDYHTYTPDKAGISPSIYYSNEDRVYVGLGYKLRRHKWRRYPFASEHELSVKYSINQKNYSIFYEGVVNQLIGNWNLALNAHYDNMRWTNFYGPGNESIKSTEVTDYYRMRSTVWHGDLEMNRKMGLHSLLRFGGFYQKVSIINDPDRYVGKTYSHDPANLEPQSFAGGRIGYDYQNFDNKVMPTKGFTLESSLTYTNNLDKSDRSFWNLSGIANTYLPLVGKLSLAVRTGAATLKGQPEFYQLNWIGGSNRLRGFRRERFYGKTAFFNNLELRLITDVRSFLYNGKAGLITFYDVGRVWLPGEQSNKWHAAYGGGVLLAPFNKIGFSLTHGKSDEGNTWHIRFNRTLF